MMLGPMMCCYCIMSGVVYACVLTCVYLNKQSLARSTDVLRTCVTSCKSHIKTSVLSSLSYILYFDIMTMQRAVKGRGLKCVYPPCHILM